MRKVILAGFGLAMLGTASASHAAVMDFGFGTGGTTHVTSATYSQNGITMTPIDDGSGGLSHWDYFQNSHGASDTDWHAAIHSGNNGGTVQFDFGGTAFDLQSLLIEGIVGPAGHASCDRCAFHLVQWFNASDADTGERRL